MENTNKRIYELDLFRGISVILMILDHFMFDIWGLLPTLFINFPGANSFFTGLYNFSLYYWESPVRIVVRYIVLFVFLALTGICCSFSRSNLKRGVKLLIVALILTIVTGITGYIIGDIDIMITFGILHSIACSLLIVSLMEKFMVDKKLYLLLGILFTAMGIIAEIGQVELSFVNNNIFSVIFQQIIGTATAGGDTASLPFHCGQIMIGVYIGKAVYADKKSLFKKEYKSNFFTIIGRNSLLFYIAHQVIIPIILGLLLLICGYKLNL